MLSFDIWAALTAAASAFLLGGLWYSPVLFGKAWVAHANTGEQSGHPGRVYGISFLFALVSAALFGQILGAAPELKEALGTGLLVGAGFVAASFGINYQFANRSTTLWLIDGGYHTVQFALYGLVFGIWPA